MGEQPFNEKSKDIVSALDCKLESGEKEKIVQLGKELEGQITTRDVLISNVKTLGEQKMGQSEEDKTLKAFLQTDIKKILNKKRAEWSEKSNVSKDYAAVQKFVQEIGVELTSICGNNRSDKVMGLQVYVNALNDINGKHAIIPYTAKNYKDYEEGKAKRLFVDGYLGPHTYNALWLVLFGEELPKTEITRNQGYEFGREEPMIIGKDQPYIPLTLPKLDKNGNIESDKTIEIIDNPKIKGSIELLYLFYDGVSKKNNLSIDIDTEIMNIMTNSKLYDENQSANPLDGYIQAIKQLNIKIAGDNSDLKKGRDVIKKFINGTETQQNAEISILNTLEYDVKSHEYVANYIASKYIDLSQDPYKSQMDNIKASTSDKDFSKYEKDIDKKWIEQKSIQKKFILETFNNAKTQATTPKLQQELCQMFEVEDVSKVTPALIGQKAEEAISLAEDDFKDSMFDNYFNKRFLEEKIRSDKASLDGFGNYLGKDKLTVLFADIQGIGYLNPSSENLETAKFIGQMVAEEAACFAIGALTAGAGGILLKAALYGKRAMKIARLAKAVGRGARIERKVSKFNQVKNLIRTVNMAEKGVRAERAATRGGRAINAGTTILGVSVSGAAFYEGTNTMQNIIKGVPMFQGWNDYPEITKSIAMFGALRIVNKLVATQKIITVAGKQFNANPFNKLLQIKNGDKVITKGMKIAGESLVGGGAIFAVEGIGEMIIDTDHDWTKEEFIQAVLMYMIFRGAGEVAKLKITKNKKTGKPEIQKENPKQLTSPKEQKQITTKSEPKQLQENNLKKENGYNKPKKNQNGEIKNLNDDISLLKREIGLMQNELNNAKSSLKNISNNGKKPELEVRLRNNVFAREQDIKFRQGELDKLILERNKLTNQSLGVQEVSVNKESKPQHKQNTKETVKEKLTKEEVKAKPNQFDKQTEIQKLADDFDARIMSNEGITIGGKNYRLVYEPNMTQNPSRKGNWKYIEDGRITSIRGNAGILPVNSQANKIRTNYNNLRNKYIESFVGKQEAKVLPKNKSALLDWIKKNPLKSGALAQASILTIGVGVSLYNVKSKSDKSGDEYIIEDVENPEDISPNDVIYVGQEDNNGSYYEIPRDSIIPQIIEK